MLCALVLFEKHDVMWRKATRFVNRSLALSVLTQRCHYLAVLGVQTVRLGSTIVFFFLAPMSAFGPNREVVMTWTISYLSLRLYSCVVIPLSTSPLAL